MAMPKALSLTMVDRSSPSGQAVSSEEAELVAGCRAGEPAAFARLLALYRQRIVDLAYQLVQNGADAEDVAQEVFLRAFENIPRFRGEAALSTWLYRITVNLCHDRRRRKAWTTETWDDLEEVAEETDFRQQVETKLLVQKTLAALPPHLRTVLVLREMQELSYEEIAQIVRRPIGTVKSRLNAARRAFQEVWEELMNEQ
jgi:RNA polymerase sigma-70 factor (ECF subfamily)